MDVLHDATVVDMSGTVPGTLRLELECNYLRDLFDAPGDRFFLTLLQCTRFSYEPWADDSDAITDLHTLATRRLWILSADPGEGYCKVHCREHIRNGSGGVLEVSAAAVTLELDEGRMVTQAELEAVAEEYWSGFGSRSQSE